MKRHASFVLTIVLSIVCLLFCSSCGDAEHSRPEAGPANLPAAKNAVDKPQGHASTPAGSFALANDSIARQSGQLQNVSAETPTPPDERKIIRNAEFTFSANNPGDTQRRITQIAEAHGGFVVKSEINKSSSDSESDAAYTSVSIVVRVPSSHFAAAIDEIRGTGNRIIQESITGQDVTEEYIDLEARLKTKKALEAQFLEILKQARTVKDAMDVQSEIADVRTEIEQMEGRRRFLENQSALSTITVTLKPPPIQVTAAATSQPGFLSGLKQSFVDAADLTTWIVQTAIRAVILLIPVAVLVFLPCFLITKFLISRFKPNRKVEAIAAD